MIILHVYIIKYTCIHIYLVMYTYSGTQMTHTFTLNVADVSAALLLSLIPNCKADHNIQFSGFAWVACVAELFWILASDQYNGQYSKSHNSYVLHDWPFSFHIWSQIEATMCTICVFIIPENSFYFWPLTYGSSEGTCKNIFRSRQSALISRHSYLISLQSELSSRPNDLISRQSDLISR